MPGSVYIDTSALAKLYLPEQGSDAVSDFMLEMDEAATISSLTITEMRCLLARRRREKKLGLIDEQRNVCAIP